MTNKDAVQSLIKFLEFKQMGNKTTVCLITCKNGFEIIGSTACADNSVNDPAIGEHWALEDATDKLIRYATFHLMQQKIEL